MGVVVLYNNQNCKSLQQEYEDIKVIKTLKH